jgi:hypothetical protein
MYQSGLSVSVSGATFVDDPLDTASPTPDGHFDTPRLTKPLIAQFDVGRHTGGARFEMARPIIG